MKKMMIILLLLSPFIFIACNNSGKDSVEKADSANRANHDSALNHSEGVIIDENSSSFLVKVAEAGMAETEMADSAQKKAYYADVRSFAGMLYHDHSGVNEKIKNLAAQKNVVLPAVITTEKQHDITELNKKTDKVFDKEFVSIMIKNHEASIKAFEKAMLDAKDNDVIALADKTLPVLRAHLDSAKSLWKRYF